MNEGEIRSESCSRSPSRSSSPQNTESQPHPQFDYMYEFSETRKVLEEFFKSGDKSSHFQVCISLLCAPISTFRDLKY